MRTWHTMTHWTGENLEFLKDKWADGWSCTQISRALGVVSPGAVYHKGRRIGLPRKTEGSLWTGANVALLRRLWDEGLTAGEISERIPGTTRSSVLGKVHRLDLPYRKGPSWTWRQSRHDGDRDYG